MHCFDSALKMSKKNYPQVYLEECKYKVKKIHTPRFINIELETNLSRMQRQIQGQTQQQEINDRG